MCEDSKDLNKTWTEAGEAGTILRNAVLHYDVTRQQLMRNSIKRDFKKSDEELIDNLRDWRIKWKD